MSYYNKRILIFFAFFILCFINPTWAIELPYLSKSKIRLSILAGQSKYGEIIIENPTPESRSMHLYLEDWRYLPDGSGLKEFISANSTTVSCASWISFSPAEFVISPFGRQRVSYSVKVPNQTQGGYYAVLFFESKLGESPSTLGGMGAGINLAVRIAALFYVEVSGTIKRTGEFQNLSLKRDDPSSPLLIEVDFLNTGNVDITCGGSFHIMDKEGIIYARGEFNDGYTFPQDKVKLSAAWKELIPKGKYDLVLTFNLGKAQEEEIGFSHGPIIVKEAKIEIDKNGEVVRVGELK